VRTFRLEREQLIELDIETTFSFFADARNLERLTPPWLRFEILSRGDAALEAGSLIDYRLRLRGVPVRWRSEITVWQPPHHFIDCQKSGPYRIWVHSHSFRAVDGGTRVRDEVLYALPGGALIASPINRLLVGPDLQRIFDYRRQRLQAWATETARRSQKQQGEKRNLRHTDTRLSYKMIQPE
jgi:ligand-binding SRPBCC domain-containing protein